MAVEDLDEQIRESPHPCPRSLLELFDDQGTTVRHAAMRIIPSIANAADRQGRRWLRANARDLDRFGPQAVRLAPTVAGGIELELHIPVAKVIDYAPTARGTCSVLFQVHAGERWDVPAKCLRPVVHNLALRTSKVPVRPSQLVLGRDDAAAWRAIDSKALRRRYG